jgi:hypothetical protein
MFSLDYVAGSTDTTLKVWDPPSWPAIETYSPGAKACTPKRYPALVVVGCVRIVVEHPSRMLRAARLVRESSDLFVCAIPKPAHPAILPVFLPQMRVDMCLAIERRHEFIAVARGAHGKFFGPSKFEPKALEHMR